MPHLGAAHQEALERHDDPGQLSADARAAWEEISGKVTQFTAADKYLVTAPMWILGVPAVMKAYINYIMVASYTFRYTGPGALVGLMEGRPLAIISSRGGIYSQPPMSEYEMCVGYLCDVFSFHSFSVVAQIVAEVLALLGHPQCDRILQPAEARAREVAATF